MTEYTHGAKKVLLDSSPFFRFCQGGQVINLAGYLGTRAYVTLEVEDELRRNAARYVDLKTLARMKWPPEDNKLELTAPLKQELKRPVPSAYGRTIDMPMSTPQTWEELELPVLRWVHRERVGAAGRTQAPRRRTIGDVPGADRPRRG